MRVVNLSRRPFVNRRPIVRFAVLLWLTGALMLLWNVRLYSGHWQGTAENRQLLAQAQERLEAAQEGRDRLARQLGDVDLAEQNRRSAFLNSLIAYRTFPWSPLFDDLEEVLPADVKLFNVQPVVRLATDVARDNQLAALRRAAEERAAARRQGRVSRTRRGRTLEGRTPEGRTPEGGTPDDETAPGAAPDESPEPPEEPELAPDEVGLRLNGLAKTEAALVELVDRLFDNPSFRRPVLENEIFDPNQRATLFTLGVVYLTRRPVVASQPAPELADEELAGGPPELKGGAAPTEPEASAQAAPAAGGGIPGAPERSAPGGGELDSAPDREALEPMAPVSGTPEGGAMASGSPTAAPAPGMPPPGGFRPLTAGAPTAGAPVAGSPAAGTPVAGSPVAGTPAAGGPAAGTPAPAAPERGSPAAGSADRGTPERAAPEGEAPKSGDPRGAKPGSDTGDRSPPDGRPGPGREEEPPAGDAGAEEPSFGERDASATPGIDRGGQVRLAPDIRRPAVPALGGALDLAEAAA